MSERKTIQINPALFEMSHKNTSRKKTPKEPKIQLKTELKTQKQKTLRKNVLKMIREKQQEAYKDLFDKKMKPATTTTPTTSFDKDFDNTLQFFSSLADKVEKEPKDITVKNYESISQPVPIINTLEPVQIQPHTNFPIFSQMTPLSPTPKYGCLKNGQLPTFRTYTRKNLSGGAPPQTTISNTFMTPTNMASEPQILTTPFDSPLLTSTQPSFGGINNRFIEQSQKFDKIHQGSTKEKAKQQIRYKKRKKIFKRTYKVGRSKISPTIGVLVSNKTIRSRISTQAQLLKQTPIQEVRKFLIKKGFIKIGTNAPNDVLRKMYETVSLVCGEIQNHNPDNLLYNFINDTD